MGAGTARARGPETRVRTRRRSGRRGEPERRRVGRGCGRECGFSRRCERFAALRSDDGVSSSGSNKQRRRRYGSRCCGRRRRIKPEGQQQRGRRLERGQGLARVAFDPVRSRVHLSGSCVFVGGVGGAGLTTGDDDVSCDAAFESASGERKRPGKLPAALSSTAHGLHRQTHPCHSLSLPPRSAAHRRPVKFPLRPLVAVHVRRPPPRRLAARGLCRGVQSPGQPPNCRRRCRAVHPPQLRHLPAAAGPVRAPRRGRRRRQARRGQAAVRAARRAGRDAGRAGAGQDAGYGEFGATERGGEERGQDRESARGQGSRFREISWTNQPAR